jgi:hypothetical protein
MKVNKMLMTLLLSVTSICLEAFIVPPVAFEEYDRIIVTAEQNYLNDLEESLDPLDANHSEMLASGVFDSQDANQLDIDTLEDLYTQYGVDLRDSNSQNLVIDPSKGTRRLVGVATMKPVAYGTNPCKPTYIIKDSDFPKRNYKWQQKQFSTVVEFETNFIVPAGFRQAGARVTQGCVFFRGFLVHGKPSQDWSKPKFSEVFRITCTQLTVQSNNMWGEKETARTYVIFKDENIKGSGLATITKVHLPPITTGTSRVEGRTVLTWRKTAD